MLAQRAELGNPFLAFLQTMGEALLALLLVRFLYRIARWLMGADSPAEHPVERAARLHAFVVPEGWVARPKAWQRRGSSKVGVPSRSPYAARVPADVEARIGATKTADPPLGAG